MKFNYLACLAFASLSMNVANANEIFYSVPFYNVVIPAASKIYVDYNFDSHHQVLHCKTASSGLINSAEWSYKDVTRKIELPIILKDDSRFVGQYADPEGKLVITNEFGPTELVVTCEYRTMN